MAQGMPAQHAGSKPTMPWMALDKERMRMVGARDNAGLLAIELLLALLCGLRACLIDNSAEKNSTVGFHFNGIPFATTNRL